MSHHFMVTVTVHATCMKSPRGCRRVVTRSPLWFRLTVTTRISDHGMATTLAAALPGSVILDPFKVESIYDTWEILTAMLQIANLVVAVRYHAAILRLIGGKSAFVLHYSNKGKDLVDRLRLPGRGLGGMCTPDLVAAIEASADKDFNHMPYARDVQSQFNRALRLAGADQAARAA